MNATIKSMKCDNEKKKQPSTSAAHIASKKNSLNAISFMENLQAMQAIAVKSQFSVVIHNFI